MDTISKGWTESSKIGTSGFVERVSNCRLSISRWWKKKIPYSRDKIKELKTSLQERQNDDNITLEELGDITRKLKFCSLEVEAGAESRKQRMCSQSIRIPKNRQFSILF